MSVIRFSIRALRRSFIFNQDFRQGISVLCFLFSIVVLSVASDAAAAEAMMHRRLIWTDNPQSQAVVCWDTPTEGESHRVYYDTKSRNAVIEDYSNSQACTANGPYSKGQDVHYHHAELKGLQPDTTYYIVMASGDASSEEFHFRTAPEGDVPLKIIFGGDSRSGIDARRKINKLIAKVAEEDESILAFAHGGDYVKNGTNFQQWQSWMDDHELTITATGRMLPLIPARGNHEARGPLYDRVMAFPGGAEGKNYFATRLSEEILFVTLNSETAPDGAQKEFLDASLTEAGSSRWRVVQYHRPLFPAVKGPGRAAKHWVPLFEKHNVALACEADGHCIKRTVPIRDGKHDPTGVVYIGEGGLGVNQRTPDSDRWYVKEPGMAGKGHHFQLLSFTKGHLMIEVIGIDGNVIDTYKIAVRDAPKVDRDQGTND